MYIFLVNLIGFLIGFFGIIIYLSVRRLIFRRLEMCKNGNFQYFNENTIKVVCVDELIGVYDIFIIEDWTYFKFEKRIYQANSFYDAYRKFKAA